jgi:hypothetical protein
MTTKPPIVQCGTCGGKYRRELPDGTMYFHACPPLSVAEIREALANGTIALEAEDQARLDAAAQLDKEVPAKEGEPTNTDRALATIAIERPNKRDENIAGAGAPGEPAPIKSPGAGVRTL